MRERCRYIGVPLTQTHLLSMCAPALNVCEVVFSILFTSICITINMSLRVIVDNIDFAGTAAPIEKNQDVVAKRLLEDNDGIV